MSVRAVVMEGPGQLVLHQLPYPELPPGGAVIQVLGNGICGSDWALFSGEQTRPGGRPAPFPLIPGHEPVGRIVELDPSAAELWGVKIGDRIVVESKASCGSCDNCVGSVGPCQQPRIYSLIGLDEPPGLWGGLAEYMAILPGSNVFRVPEHVSDDDATMFNPLGNAFYWVSEVGRVTAGDRVLILGAGQRGLCCAVAAREAGASQIIVTGLTRDANKLALAPRFGATDVLDVEQDDTVRTVRELTGGSSVDVVIDTVPVSTAPLAHGVELLKPRGRLVLAGVRPSSPAAFPLEQFRVKQLSMVGVSGTTRTAVARAIDTIAADRYPFSAMHTDIYELADAETAIRALGDSAGRGARPIHILVKARS